MGYAHELFTYFRKQTIPNTWDWYALIGGDDIEGGKEGAAYIVDQGVLTFAGDGTLAQAKRLEKFDNVMEPGRSISEFDWILCGESNSRITSDFGKPDMGQNLTTQWSDSDSSLRFVRQDGYPAGSLSSIWVDADGYLRGKFSNGRTRALYSIPVAVVAAPYFLRKISYLGLEVFQTTEKSGPAMSGFATLWGREGIQWSEFRP